jgi:hypothetical protein
MSAIQDGVAVEIAKTLDSFLDRASTTAFSAPFLYSMVQLNSSSFSSSLC